MLIKTHAGWKGATPHDHEQWTNLNRSMESAPVYQQITIEWNTKRNVKHHRKLFALLQLICNNTEYYDTPERALVAVKLAAAFYDPIVDPVTGHVEKIPHSICFEKMGQEDFEVFYSAAIHGVVTSILPQFDKPTFDYLLDEIIRGWDAKVPTLTQD